MHRYRGLIIKLLASIFTLLLSLGLPLNTLAQENFKVYLPVILSDGSGNPPPLFPQAPDVPPSNFADLLEQNVADGIWTEAEGIVQILKLLNEEVPPEDIPGLDTVVFGEATGVVSLANEYLADNPDPTLAAEIERLLGTIFPPQANLNHYSAPITNTTSINGVQTADAQQCDDLWSRGLPIDVTVSGVCIYFLSFELGGKLFEVYYPAKWQGDNNKLEYFAAAFNAMSASYRKYQPYGEVPPATVVFSPVPDARSTTLGGAFSSAITDYGYDFCPIALFPGAFDFPLDPKQFQQIVAHEMFHCFQGVNLEAQWSPGYKAVAWWAEGTAEYFSNEVYPQADREQVQWLDRFNAASAYGSILFFDYENFIFFQHLGNRLGNEGLLNLLGTLPTSPNASNELKDNIKDQARALAKYPDIHNIFQQFGQDYFDGKIIDSSGAAIPSANLPLYFTGKENDPTVFAETGDMAEFDADVFRLTRHALDYERGKFFSQNYQLNSARHVVKPLQVGAVYPFLEPNQAWTALPTEIDAGCGDETRYFLLLTQINVGGFDFSNDFQNVVTVLDEKPNCCYIDIRLEGTVAGRYQGPAFYDLPVVPDALVMTTAYEQWVSQIGIPAYTTGVTGTVPGGFTMSDNGAGFIVAAPEGAVLVTVEESEEDFVKGRLKGTVDTFSGSGAGQANVFAEFKAARALTERANQCDLQWE